MFTRSLAVQQIEKIAFGPSPQRPVSPIPYAQPLTRCPGRRLVEYEHRSLPPIPTSSQHRGRFAQPDFLGTTGQNSYRLADNSRQRFEQLELSTAFSELRAAELCQASRLQTRGHTTIDSHLADVLISLRSLPVVRPTTRSLTQDSGIPPPPC